jgi:hypothetical protein
MELHSTNENGVNHSELVECKTPGMNIGDKRWLMGSGHNPNLRRVDMTSIGITTTISRPIIYTQKHISIYSVHNIV